MRRLTISVDDDLADTFDRLVQEKGYGSRSEAFRDLVRGALDSAQLDAGSAKHCVAPSAMSITITNGSSPAD